MAKILLATMGSSGDVLPFIAIGDALKRIGHEPIIASQGLHRSVVIGNGLAFRPVRPSVEDLVKHTGRSLAELVQQSTQGFWPLLREIYRPFTAQIYEDVTAASAGASLIVAHNLLFGGIMAAEVQKIPLVRVAVSPVLLQSAVRPSVTSGVPYRVPPQGDEDLKHNRAARMALRQQVRKEMGLVYALRRHVGLAPTSADFAFDFGQPDYATSVLATYSPVLAPLQPDHPKNAVITGFPFFNAAIALNPALTPLHAFFQSGPPPVVLTLGSFTVEAAADFYSNGLAACRKLGLRSLLIAGKAEAERLTPLGGPDTFICAYAPYGPVFDRAAAIVHHGGTGTVALAMLSGKPQLIVPMVDDQIDNAHRLTELGVARRLMIKRKVDPEVASVERMTQEIGLLMTDPRYREAGTRIAAAVKTEDGAMTAARHIDALVNGKLTAF